MNPASDRDSELFARLVRRAPFPVAVTDGDTIVVAVNAAFLRLLGWSPAECIGLELAELFGPLHAEEFAAAWQICDSVGGFQGVLHPRQLPDGGQTPLATALYRLGDDRQDGYAVVLLDSPEQHEALEELRHTQELFELALRGSKDGVWDWNLETDGVDFSAGLFHLLGHAEGSYPARLETWEAWAHPDDRAMLQEMWQSCREGTNPRIDLEHRLEHRDGDYRWVLAQGIVLRDARGTAYRAVGSFTDTTPRRRAEEEARRHQDELAHLQRVSTVGELTQGLAHELNQPLNVIANYGQGCLQRLRAGQLPDDALAGVLEQIVQQALLGAAIIKRTSLLLRKREPERQLVELGGIVAETVEMFAEEANQRRLFLICTRKPREIWVRIDRVRIQQIVLNLVRNAMDAAQRLGRSNPDGSHDGAVRVDVRQRRKLAVVRVQDDGPGIPPDVEARLFEPFFTTKKNGLGVGLSISRSLAQNNGGELRLRTPGGNGRDPTTFELRLPLAPERAAAESAGP